MKKYTTRSAFMLVTVLSLVLFAPSQVSAAARIQQSSVVNTSVKGKSLTLTAPASATMGAVDVAVTPTEATGTLAGIQVADLRGKKPPLGWSLTITATDFVSAGADKIPVTALKIGVAQYQFLAGTDGGIIVPGTISLLDSKNNGVSDAATLLNANSGFGAGQFSISPILKLLVPAFSVAGDYQSTLTLTLS